ncbi:sulfonate transport system ATP-binding protein [Candidatus Planktophila sulfonica]|uniref:Sulfonate transport system ATP-binding protein n=1 Tax=Candidatus Planktophila sulfonica TaxID=1884904 RepID=A0A249KI59_9ACTN|nr:ABC transporter ATP-binding protein [Candidatus Planktophila sulfonica]ASY16385.1 sulfonate transport system ATP-binding protein [Candidatus Planktophila sulfonica]
MSSTLAESVIHKTDAANVSLKKLSKSFTRKGKELSVIKDVNLEIKSGEIVALLGPSGCGKSTLLRLIAGLEVPTSGEVTIDERKIVGLDDRCSIVFQEPRLLPWRTIVENVELGLRGRKDNGKALQLLAEVGLGDFAACLPRQVSGGMAQRAALSRALISEPQVLLLDEPLAALDALTRLQMQDLLSQLVATTGVTIVLVTHDIDEALYLADRIVVLGERGQGIKRTFELNLPHPRDRKDASVASVRTELYSIFGIHA